MILPQEIIRKKNNKEKDNNILTINEINLFVKGLTDGSFTDEQIALMSKAILLNGMSEQETISLTKFMTSSGKVLSWNDIDNGFICDKHSTGGVGDKVSLILAPIIAACGGYVPMISGRALGHTGGTLDKFDSIPGYNTQPEIKIFKNVVKNVGCAIIGQTNDLAPADKKLYAIRDSVGTIESIPLITSSILSKKIAAGLKNLVLDIKVGNGSFNKDIVRATNLAKSLVNVARGAGLSCSAIITDMNQVLGNNVGNSLEVIESIEYLINKIQNKRLKEVVTNLSVELLCMKDESFKQENALNKVNEVLNNGKAAEKFEMMVAGLGGPKNILSSYKKELKKTSCCIEIYSKDEGYIHSMMTKKIGILLIKIGGGRKNINDKINYSVGFSEIKNIGDKVNKKTPLLKVHLQDRSNLEVLRSALQNCFLVKSDKPKLDKVIYNKVS